MKKNYLFFSFLLLSYFGYSQITFNGCHPFFDDQNFVFTNLGLDTTGRNVYETRPIDGQVDCGGLGTCEFRIYWNESEARWEFIADSGNGGFFEPYLMFTNTNPSTPNPPSLKLGIWVENISLTEGGCTGNLTEANADFLGDVQDFTLGVSDNNFTNHIQLIPNPAKNIVLLIDSSSEILMLEIYDINGKLLRKESHIREGIDVSNLPKGVYFVKLIGKNYMLVKKLIKE
ncbi:T9SS type A sorting domain-containing protein [Bizionia argentinensis JUB59]|uniref:T9SS type A sorting domain-containing protein n=1 Tax=Bizionia argentinensis JUB59 TaxID=1046627 RepID=G2EFR4_9FLAO|nr:T9SS type A sorting domain-containing protein [Bizionia argentinensis]EGV42694.1 T9SS type A sorting domain-containing protein [Bizionia argentinensis JUB59]